jgi:SAM-dependent methyltransferase
MSEITEREPLRRLQEIVERDLPNKSAPRILEAGCGSVSHVKFPGTPRLIGIDISDKQLARNSVLDEKIVGDIQTYELPECGFDAVICWTVLEHVDRPDLAVERFARALKPGGLIIIDVPNLLSIKGLVTKLTPHWFHVMYYRLIRGQKNAGREDRAPFRTTMRYSISLPGLRKVAEKAGLQVHHVDYVAFDIRQENWLFSVAYSAMTTLFRVFSFGTLGEGELICVLRKPGLVESDRKVAC